jgi:DNA polymerase elongation subunit (family B)
MKLRGIAARRRDIPAYIKRMQLEILEKLSRAENGYEICEMKGEILKIYRRYRKNLWNAEPEQLVIRKVIGRSEYSRRCAEASLLRYCRERGIGIQPGMEIGYVVLDSRKWVVIPEWEVEDLKLHPDIRYYLKILERAWEEVSITFEYSRICKK